MRQDLDKDNYEFNKKENEMHNALLKKKRIMETILNSLFYLLLVVVLLFSFVFSQSTNPDKSIFSYRIFNVLTSSMDSAIPKGSFTIVEVIDKNDIQIGDDITFYSNPTTTVTHRVVNIYENYQKSGVRAFQTKGVDNQQVDKDVALAPNVVGKVVWHLPKAGFVIDFISKNLLLVIIIFVLIILLSFSLRTYLRKEKE